MISRQKVNSTGNTRAGFLQPPIQLFTWPLEAGHPLDISSPLFFQTEPPSPTPPTRRHGGPGDSVWALRSSMAPKRGRKRIVKTIPKLQLNVRELEPLAKSRDVRTPQPILLHRRNSSRMYVSSQICSFCFLAGLKIQIRSMLR